MAGLGVLLEAQKGIGKRPQIISKTTMTRPSPAILPGSTVSSSPNSSTFLDACSLCRKQLSPENDIYMYRGDGAFCSEECRFRQIIMDEECLLRDNCSFLASSSSSSRRRKGSKSRVDSLTNSTREEIYR